MSSNELGQQRQAISFPLPSVPVAWNKRDVLLFANSIGCQAEEPWYLYENHPNFSPFPTYPIVLTFKHSYTETSAFASHFDKYINVPIPGAPKFDSTRVVDGGRSLQILKALPTSSANRNFQLRSSVVEVGDKGRAGTAVVLEHVLYETVKPSGEQKHDAKPEEITFARMRETAFYLGQGNWNGPRGSKPVELPAPEGEPDYALRHEIPRTAHLLYRLNGDYNPLHAEEKAGKAAGFDGVIMHGLYTWNTVCRQVLSVAAGGKASALKEFQARFAAPVRPGDALVTSIWRTDNATKDGVEIRFVATVNGKLVLKDGRAIIREDLKSKI